MKIGIVVVGYKRSKSVERLLESLKNANYDDDLVDLVISIDKSDEYNVQKVAKDFYWKYGEKIIIEHDVNLGLRKHILKCGDLTEKYEAIIVLEDDIYVSPAFYTYTKQALNKYMLEENIRGISLYSHKWNVNSNRPFEPEEDIYDIYFLQYAQSWGQVWTKKWWSEFKEWYGKNCDEDLKKYNIPNIVSQWPSTSWLKYHIAYLACNNKYFVYPRISLSTNFTEVGQHVKKFKADYQVSLLQSDYKDFLLCDFEKGIKYDVFFERISSQIIYDKKLINDTCIDIYGTKKFYENKRFLLSTNIKNYDIIKSYGLVLRPHEVNIKLGICGNQIFLYDLNKKNKNKNKKYNRDFDLISYDVKSTNRKKLMLLILDSLKEKIRRILK